MDSLAVDEQDFCGEASFYRPRDLEAMGVPNESQLMCVVRRQAEWARREGRGLVLVAWPDGIYTFITLPPGGPMLICGRNRLLLWDGYSAPEKFPCEIRLDNHCLPIRYIRARFSLGQVFELSLDGTRITAVIAVRNGARGEASR